MRTLKPEIFLQKLIGDQLRSILQCDTLFEVRHARQGTTMDFQQRSVVVANSMKVTPQTMPEFYELCTSVKEMLEYNEEVNFYITGDSAINALSYLAEDENVPHIVIVNSGLFNLMNENELRFIIGHELGHLINKDIVINRQVSFIYPNEDDEIPTHVKNRIEQYAHLAEYGADRYGFLACMDLDACISAFYKLNSGINLQEIGVSIEALLEENSAKMNYIMQNGVVYGGSHPGTPMRVHALMLFACCKTQKALDEEMDHLLDLLPNMCITRIEHYYCRLCIAAGYTLAEIDGKIDKRESAHIIETIGEFVTIPSRVIKLVLKEEREQVINEAISVIKDLDPIYLEKACTFLVEVSIQDGIIAKSELDFIKEFCQNRLGLDIDTIYEIIETVVSRSFNCSTEGI